MFETRSHEWESAGLRVEVDRHQVRRAVIELALLVPLLIGVVVVHGHARDWFGKGVVEGADLIAALAVLGLGWLMSRDIAALTPVLFRRMDPATAGTVEFLIRFAAVSATVLGALYIAGVDPKALLVGGAFTAIVLGLAAQQTLGNLFAGMVLITARPFRLGERIRLQAGAVGGSTEGIVSSLGLLYTTLARGEDRIMIPNNVVLAAVVVPLREPQAVEVRVRVPTSMRLSALKELLDAAITTPTRAPVDVVVEELAGEDLVVRVRATPEGTDDGARLADEIIAALATLTGREDAPGDAVDSPSSAEGAQVRLPR